MDLPKILDDLLPKSWVTGLSSAIAIAAIASSLRSLLRKGAGGILGQDVVWRLRVFFLSLIVLILVQSLLPMTPPDTRTAGQRLVPPFLIALFYVVGEGGLFAWLLHFRRKKTLFPDEYLRRCSDILKSRQTPEGAFRVKGGIGSRVELWTTAQVFHALVTAIDRVDMTGVTARALVYYKAELAKPGTIWTDGTAALTLPSAWVVLSLAAFAKSAHWKNLTTPDKGEVRELIKKGFATMVSLQTDRGGWTPLGSDRVADIRTLPTVIVLWAIATVLDANAQADLSEEEVAKAVGAIDRASGFLRDSSAGTDDEKWWDSNPGREWRQKSLGLTLLTYGVLLAVSEALGRVPGADQNAQNLRASLGEWGKQRHDSIMGHIDHCLHRDLEDNEADGPWDHIVANKAGAIVEVPITYFDWPSSALFALNMCKRARLYDYSDAAREQTLTSLLTSAPQAQDHAYSFRLAMMLIASAVDGPIASL